MTSNCADSYIRLYYERPQCPDCAGGGKVVVTVWPGIRGESLAPAHVPLKLELERCKTCGGSGRSWDEKNVDETLIPAIERPTLPPSTSQPSSRPHVQNRRTSS